MLWPRVGSQLAPPLWPHPVAAQLCSWGVPTHEECDGVALELLCKELLFPPLHHRVRFRYFPAPPFNFNLGQRETSFPFCAESQLEWPFLQPRPQFLLSQAKPASLALLLGKIYKSTTQPSHAVPYMTLRSSPFPPERTVSHLILCFWLQLLCHWEWPWIEVPTCLGHHGCNLMCAQVCDMAVSVLTCGCFRVCFFQPFCLQSLSLASPWSRISATSRTKASGSIVPLPGRSAAAAQEGAGSTCCGTGPPARPAALGAPRQMCWGLPWRRLVLPPWLHLADGGGGKLGL